MIKIARQTIIKEFIKRKAFDHNVYTPEPLMRDVIDNIGNYVDITNKSILVLYNMEFAVILNEEYNVDWSKITLFTNHAGKIRLCKKKGINVINSLEETDVKFDIVLGNPPFSNTENKTSKKGRASNLYPIFYKKSIELAKYVAMIVPRTDKQNSKFNKFIRENTNEIIEIPNNMFSTINIETWCLIKNNNGKTVDHIDWYDLHDMPEQNVNWGKGKINVTSDKELLIDDKDGEITIYHKINTRNGLICTKTNKHISQKKLFPNSGYAIIMPQQINKNGWTITEIVKCNGKQAATNGVNLAFVKTKTEAYKLIDIMQKKDFIDQALKYCGGMNNMTLTALKKIQINF